MAVTDRHLDTIEDSIDSHPIPIYKNETFVYIFEDGHKKSYNYPLDNNPGEFMYMIRNHGMIDDMQVMKE